MLTRTAVRLAAACALAVSLPAPAQQVPAPAQQAPAAERPVTVNGREIPASRIDAMVKQLVAQGQTSNPALRSQVVRRLVDQELAFQEAEKRGLLNDPNVQVQMELARQQVAIQALLRDHFRQHPVGDKELQSTYNKLKEQPREQQYRARHILVDSETKARSIIAQLDKGTRFETLAKQSSDVGSRDKGGDLGWSAPTSYVKPFADALVKLQKGQYTKAPVQSQFGWHVIRLDDLSQFPSYDQAKQQLQQMVHEQEVQKLLAELRSKAKISE